MASSRHGMIVLSVILLAVVVAIGQPGRAAANDPTTYTLVDAAGSAFVSWQGGDATSAVFENVPNLDAVWKWQDDAWHAYVSDPEAPSRLKADYALSTGDVLFVVSSGPVTLTLGAEVPPVGDCAFVDGADLVLASTAQVETPDGTGTAFYIGDDEWITAAHVVEGHDAARLRTGTFDRTATVVGRDDAADLALLRASGEGLNALRFGDHDALRVGETLGLAGYPVTVAGSASVTRGLLSKVVKAGGNTYLQTDAAANPGNSGGPLFTDCGAVVGVVVAKIVGEAIEGIAWAVALPTITDRLPALRTGEVDSSLFTITAFCNAVWAENQYQRHDSAEACKAAGADGLYKGEAWDIWVTGVENWNHVRYSINGGRATPAGKLRLRDLDPGEHTIEVRELRDGEWSDWSAPYTFTIRPSDATRPLRITGICNAEWVPGYGWDFPGTANDCEVAGAAGLITGGSRHWIAVLAGVEDFGRVVYRIDGGAPFSFATPEDFNGFRALAPGEHTVEAREQRRGEWTPWSAPYTFTTRRR